MDYYRQCSDKIVVMLCDGKTVSEITKELGISKSNLEDRLRELRRLTRLPYEKRYFRTRREDVLSNLSKLRAFEDEVSKLRSQYESLLVHFE